MTDPQQRRDWVITALLLASLFVVGAVVVYATQIEPLPIRKH